MSALRKFEEFMENVVEGSVARLFRNPVQPAEIARRLERAMESHQSIGVKRVIVPSIYRAYLHPQDYAAFEAMHTEIEREMAAYLSELAAERNFTLLEHPRVQLLEDPAVPNRSIQVVAEMASAPGSDATQVLTATAAMPAVSPPPQQRALLHMSTAGGLHSMPIESTTVSIGRGLSNDIIVEDSRVSRHHAQLRYRNRKFWLADLGSTNGTFLNGERVSERALTDGDIISLGGLELTFREGRDV
jgi:hypothetical protein